MHLPPLGSLGRGIFHVCVEFLEAWLFLGVVQKLSADNLTASLHANEEAAGLCFLQAALKREVERLSCAETAQRLFPNRTAQEYTSCMYEN